MFDLINKKSLPLLGVEAQIYKNERFSCQHIHLDCDSNEKSFVVAFRTIPKDSRGVAHILEHTVLCGSKQYPVRDPFFSMMKRSLSTFMNAMTYPDITAYPFATLNDKDFNNLLSVYLDATFFPNLDELDFMQEGHRFELIKDKKGKEKLSLKGIVFNEMKGAMSSVPSQLQRGISEFLYPDTTYGYNSGGDPDVIPDLTYEDLVNFHKTHYHPSNACFFSHGNIDINNLQKEIDQKVLSKFLPSKQIIRVKTESCFDKPLYAQKSYQPLPDDINNHHVLIGWVLGSSLNPIDKIEAYLLSNILLDNSASPLMKAIETSDLGRSPSPLNGLDAGKKQLVFYTGLEGVKKNCEKKVEKLILNVFRKLVKDGIPKNFIKAALHQIEISQRKISGGYPYGLQLLLGPMPSILHDASALEVLDLQHSLNKLKERLKKPRHLEKLIEKYFITNNHCVTFQLIPDINFDKNKSKISNEYLNKKLKAQSKNDKKKIKDLTLALEKRQDTIDDINILPCVTVKDISQNLSYPSGKRVTDGGIVKYLYNAGTNGIDNISTTYGLTNPSFKDLKFGSLFSTVVSDVGIIGSSYEDVQKRQSLVLGDLGFRFNYLAKDINNHFPLSVQMSGFSLQENFDKMKTFLHETICNFRLDEIKRVEDLTKFYIANFEKIITGSGHAFAMYSASSQVSLKATIEEYSGGISSLHNIKSLRDENANIDLDILLKEFRNIKNKINIDPLYEVIVSARNIDRSLKRSSKTGLEKLSVISDVELEKEEVAWLTETDVNFCAQAFPTVDYIHEDSPSLQVLGAVLRNSFLHSSIREKGGAYGAGSMQDSSTGVFKFFSYRDPNIRETFGAFNSSIEWALKSITEKQLEEGILGVISSIDTPSSPTGEALSDHRFNMLGITQQLRKKYRQRVIDCSVSNLIEVTKKYLLRKPKRAIISGKNFEKELTSMDFNLRQI